MCNIPTGSILLSVEILRSQWVIIGGVGGIALVILLVVLLLVFKGGKGRKEAIIKLTGEGTVEAWPRESYTPVTERIRKLGKKRKSVLFASVEAAALPVAMPAAVAGILAKDGRKCLLVDLDLENDSVAKTFHVGSGRTGLPGMVVETRFENVSLWPAHNFVQLHQMNIREIVDKAQEQFDIILLNAPGLLSSPDRRQIISSAACAFICSKGRVDTSALSELIDESDCRIIGHLQTP